MTKTRGNSYLRFLDRYLGILLAKFCFRRKRLFPSGVQKIGILKLAGIGDLILLSGVIADLRHHYPNVTIILFCGKENGAIAHFIPGVKVIPLSLFSGIRLLRGHQLDLLLDFEQWARIDVLMSYFSKAKFTVGFQTKGQYRHGPFDLAASHQYELHEIDNFRKIGTVLGVKSRNLPTLCFPERNESLPERYVLFHPWSVSLVKQRKEWPSVRWITLGRYLKEKGYSIFITGAAADEENSKKLAKAMGASSLAGKTSFALLAHYLKKAACLVTVDTGVMHLAAALDVPLVALFGPTSVHRWGPLSKKAKVLSGGIPYFYLGFEKSPDPKAQNMEKISVESVIEAVEKVLGNADQFFPNEIAPPALPLFE